MLPAFFQKFVVEPNKLSLETPYLKNYIAFTRKAYTLDRIQETAYPAMADLTPAVLTRNQDTIRNIRLWDKRPLLQTFNQTQAIRLYYKFNNVHLVQGGVSILQEVHLALRLFGVLPFTPELRRFRSL